MTVLQRTFPLFALGIVTIMTGANATAALSAPVRIARHHHHASGGDAASRPAAPSGFGTDADAGGYRINRQGFGNDVPGADGSFGGYPAGSAGAEELQNNQRYKCRDLPETC